MSDNSKLLVPMHMEALVLGRNKDDCINLSPQFMEYDQSILGDVLEPNVKNTFSLEKGIHLHWTLPKALKHSFVDEDEEMSFPFAPNRWMVTRIQTNEGIEDMPSRIWIVESDATNNSDPNWILMKDNKLDFRSIGKNTEWSEDYEEDTSESILTAVGAANPFFASFYPGCRNVFGFHDDMSDEITNGDTFTYIVTGWYSDPSLDPLTPLDFTGEPINEEQKRKKRALEWFKQQWECSNVDYPTSSMLHSSIHSIKWSTDERGGSPRGGVQIFAGNTAIESLSAQIAKSAPDFNLGMEELVNALQYQFLEDDTNQPSLKTIKTEMHKRGFTPKNRNILWEIVHAEADDKQLEEQKESRIHFPNDIRVLNALKELNEKQNESNKDSEEISSLQQEYYFLWYKQATKTVGNYDVKNFDYEEARKNILDKIDKKKDEIDLLKTDIEQLISRLNENEYLAGPNAEFQLKEKLEDRFWEPNDPVLLLCGTGIGNTEKPNLQTSKNEIYCRTIDQVFKKLKLSVPYNQTKIDVEIPKTSFSVTTVDVLIGAKIPFEEIKVLVYETLLLDHGLSVDISLLAYIKAQLGEGRDKTSSIVRDFAKNTVVKEQNKPTSVNDDIQVPEMFSISKWEQAWSPLFMVWDVEYSAIDSEINNLDLLENTDNWKLEEGLFFKNQVSTVNSQRIQFNGVSPFSSAVFENLKRNIPREIVNKYGDLNLIAQSLSGLNKFLLMQKPGIQFPPFIYTPDEDYNFDTSYLIDQEELDVIGDDAYSLGCHSGEISGEGPNLFFPLRSGTIQIKNLSIIDAFGQVKKIIIDGGTNNPDVRCSVSIKGVEMNLKNSIPLPPRIVQPSRLQFNWLNSQDEIIYQDTGKLNNPILGWLVPNYLDKSILLYDGDGNEIAILQITSDITKDKGLHLSKIPFPGENNIPDLSNNIHLEQFLDAINKASIASGIMDLANKVNLNLAGTNAMQNNTTALLCGQPIAIARCSVGLESLGLPAYNQRWDESGKENSGGIESVKFPLFIGDFTLEKDGLLGCFMDDNYTGFYTTMNAPEFNFSESEAFFRKNSPRKLSLNQEALKMTLLIDPSAGVHLSTGILPTKFVELFGHNSSEQLSSLNTSFMVAPFIAEKVEPDIPIPTSINANWKWTHKSDVTTWIKDEDISEGKRKQLSGFKKQQIYEGWLKLSNLKTNN